MNPILSIAAFSACALSLSAQSPYAALEVPKQIQYQGRVATGTGAAWNGPEGYFAFALVQGATVLWNNWEGTASPSDPGAVSLGAGQVLTLPVDRGVFSIRLGEGSDTNEQIPATVFFDAVANSVRSGVKLAVWFSPDGGTFTRLSPDVEFSAAPYAMISAIAETVKERAVTTAMLSDEAVETVKLANGALTTGKLADAAVTSAKILDGSVASADLIAGVREALVPPGTILPFGGANAPVGFLLCDGRTYPRSGTYEPLFDTISTNFGAPSSTSFNVPDLRGQFLRGIDSLPDVPVAPSVVNTSSDAITLTANGFNRSGVPVRIGNTGGALPSPLNASTTYYVIMVDPNTIKLATTEANALANASVDMTTQGTGTHMIVSWMDPDKAMRGAMASGAAIGNAIGSVQGDELKNHEHNYIDVVVGGNTNLEVGGGGVYGRPTMNRVTGSSGGSETRPRNACVNYIIKY